MLKSRLALTVAFIFPLVVSAPVLAAGKSL